MRAVAQYAYLDTRVNLMARQLLDPDRVNALIDRRGENAPTRSTARVAVPSPYVGDLDQANVTILLQELSVLIRPASGAARDLLAYWAHRFELNNLKVLIRGKMAEQPQDKIEAQLLDMGRFASLPVRELLQCDTSAELLRRLEQTPYGEIARQARHLLEQGEALFALDATLDRRYFAGLFRRGRALGGTSGQHARAIIGSIIDRVNLVWLLRYRFAYNLPPAQAYYLLIPASHRLTAPQLLKLSQHATFGDAIVSLPEPFAGLLAGARNTTEVTLRLERETWHISAHALYHSVYNIARALAYMVLRERDLRRLRAIVRGHETQMNPTMIRAALGLDAEGNESRIAN